MSKQLADTSEPPNSSGKTEGHLKLGIPRTVRKRGPFSFLLYHKLVEKAIPLISLVTVWDRVIPRKKIKGAQS